MCLIVFLALILTVFIQQAQIRNAGVREARLRASLAEAETKAAWVESLDEWHRLAASPSLNKRWAEGMRRANGPVASP